MKRFLTTDSENWTGLFARWAVAIAVFPHGAQKLLGWFGGGGFEGAMHFMTEIMNLPWILGFMVIIIEFFGSVLLALGLLTRFTTLAMIFNFIGVVYVDALNNGFFMNWAGVEGQGEGLEYFVLLFGLMIISMIVGGGKTSLDARLFPKGSNE